MDNDCVLKRSLLVELHYFISNLARSWKEDLTEEAPCGEKNGSLANEVFDEATAEASTDEKTALSSFLATGSEEERTNGGPADEAKHSAGSTPEEEEGSIYSVSG